MRATYFFCRSYYRGGMVFEFCCCDNSRRCLLKYMDVLLNTWYNKIEFVNCFCHTYQHAGAGKSSAWSERIPGNQ